MLKRSLSIVLLIIFFTATLAGTLYALYRLDLVRLPASIVRLIDPAEPMTEILTGDGGLIYEALNAADDELPEGVTVVRDLTQTDLAALLETLKPAPPLNITNRVTLYENGASASYVNAISITTGGFTAKITRDGKVNRSITCAGDYITVTESGGKTSRLKLSDTHNLYTLCGIPDVGLLMDWTDKKPRDIKIVRTDVENLLSFTLELEQLGTTESYIVSLDYGIILKAESMDSAGRTVYALSTTEILQR